MNSRQLIAFVLLLSLILAAGPAATPTGAGSPEGSAAEKGAGPVPSLARNSAEGPIEGPSTTLEKSANTTGYPPGVAEDWWATVQEDIRTSEYHITWQEQTYLDDVESAYHAPSRAQNLRTYFTPEGIRVMPRTYSGVGDPADGGRAQDAWQLRLALAGYGLADELVVVDNRVEYRRAGVSEWYVNSKKGLAWWISLTPTPCPPAAGCPPPPLRGSLPPWEAGQGGSEVTLALHTTPSIGLRLRSGQHLTPHLIPSGDTIEFTNITGDVVLRYGPFSAVDAQGHAVPLALELSASTLYLQLSGSNLQPPITLHATLTSALPPAPDGLSPTPDWTVESDQEEAFLGCSVGTAGDVDGDGYSDVVVGAYRYDNGQTNEGRAFFYSGSPAGLSLSPGWTAEGDQEEALFSWSVGTAGDVDGDGFADVVVGAIHYDNGQPYEGRAFVYHGSPAGPSPTPNWTAEGDLEWAVFGCSVGTAGDVNGDGFADVVVGARYYNNGQGDEGRAYVYQGSPSGLSPTHAWTAEGNQGGAQFGYSVGTAGDVNGDGYADIVVGARYYDHGQSNEGRAFVYHGSNAGLSPTPNWTAEGNQLEAHFGYSVGTAGDVNGDGYSDVVIGADGYDNGHFEEGRAYVYHGSVGGLQSTPAWTAEGNQFAAYFGSSVGTAGDVNGDGYADIVVGALCYNHGQSNEGRAFVYHGSNTGLSPTPNWTGEGNLAYAYFGSSVGTAGDVNGDGFADVVVGAISYNNGQPNEGRAFVYHGSPGGLQFAPTWTAEGDQATAVFGRAVGTAGDVNGDGYADVVVGAHYYDSGRVDEGRAFVYHGSPSGLPPAPTWTAEGGQSQAYFGISAGTAGDVNGDGYTDIIVGAYMYDNGQMDEGCAFVYHGAATGLDPTPNWTAEGDQAGAFFGISVGTAGDVDGDGFSDVIVGAMNYDNSQFNEGAAFAYHGSGAGLSPIPNWMAVGNQIETWFGRSVSTAGDVNGDGYSDVIIGASDYDNNQVNEGRAFVYHGSSDGLQSAPAWTAEGDQDDAAFGISVGTAGDVDGDGFSDVIVGAIWYDNGQTNEGRAFVYHGSQAGLSMSPTWTAEGDQAEARFATSGGTAGDVNGDGYADIIIGARSYDNGQVNEGRAFVYHGSALGLSTTANWIAESDQEGALFGWSTGAAGDVNGDGYSDVIIGAPLYDSPGPDEGAVFLYYGNGGDGLDLLPRQMRTDGSVHIAPLGRSDSPTAVQLRLTGRMPLGRDAVKLHWQVAPLGTPFTATEVISGTSVDWTDTLTSGVVITQNVDGLTPFTPYHWRVCLLYRPGNRLGQPASHWVHIPWNGWTEQDFRTLEEPITGLVAVNDSPTALGQPTTLTATISAGSSVSYTWAFDDGGLGSGAVLSHTYPTIGTYLALVTASNSVSMMTATTVVTIEEAIAGLTAANDSPTVLGNPTALTASVSAGNPIAYDWAFGDGTFGSGATPTYVYPAAGVYTAVVTASNQVSLMTASTVVIIEEAIAGLTATNDSPTALGDPTILTATVTAGSSVVYEWAFGDGGSGSGAMLSHTYPAAGTYSALVTASNSVSEMTTTTEVVVKEALAGLAAINDSPTALGDPTTLTATVVAGDPVVYTWVFGDGGSGSGAALTHTYPAAGLYSAVVTASNSVSQLTATTVVVVEEALAGLAAINDSPTALGDPTFLTATVTAGSNVTYAWAFGDGGSGSGAALTHTYPAAGLYSALVTASNSVSQLTATTEVVVVVEAVAGLAAVNDSPTALGDPTLLTATVTAGSNVSYTWDLGDGPLGIGTVVSHTYPAAGTYSALVTASNSVSQLTATTEVVVEEALAGLVAINDSPTALGGPTILTATVTAGSNVVYEWAFGDGGSGSGAALTHTYPAAGLYSALVTASNSVSEMTATTTVTITGPSFHIYLPMIAKPFLYPPVRRSSGF